MDEITSKYLHVYRERYAEFGDECRALGWTRADRVQIRHRIMSEVIRWSDHWGTVSLLDFGCGLGHFLDHVHDSHIRYTGLDIVPEFITECKHKYPDVEFLLMDIADEQAYNQLPTYDYIIANGVFTQKLDTPYLSMWEYFTSIVKLLYEKCARGIAFNVMSAHVNWERDDLFYVPLADMADFVLTLSPEFTFRYYGMWEYTVYVYH